MEADSRVKHGNDGFATISTHINLHEIQFSIFFLVA